MPKGCVRITSCIRQKVEVEKCYVVDKESCVLTKERMEEPVERGVGTCREPEVD